MIRLTARVLDAINAALSAALAGLEGEGDMADTPFRDLEDAQTWVHQQLAKRATTNQGTPNGRE